MSNSVPPKEERQARNARRIREQAGLDEGMLEQLVRGEQTARELLNEHSDVPER